MEILKELLSGRPVSGRVEWIGIAELRKAPLKVVGSAKLIEQFGIEGEHHGRLDGISQRQVTLIQKEHFPVIQSLLGYPELVVSAELLRRNIVVSGINLAALRHQTFRIGTAVLKGSGKCPPCSRMEENLGPGGYAAMLGHGGITAVVLQGGMISLNDEICVITENGSHVK